MTLKGLFTTFSVDLYSEVKSGCLAKRRERISEEEEKENYYVRVKSKSQLQLIECAVRSFVVGDLNIKYRTDIGKQVGQCNILSRCQISGSFRFSFVYSFRFNQSQTPLFILPTFSTLSLPPPPPLVPISLILTFGGMMLCPLEHWNFHALTTTASHVDQLLCHITVE